MQLYAARCNHLCRQPAAKSTHFIAFCVVCRCGFCILWIECNAMQCIHHKQGSHCGCGCEPCIHNVQNPGCNCEPCGECIALHYFVFNMQNPHPCDYEPWGSGCERDQRFNALLQYVSISQYCIRVDFPILQYVSISQYCICGRYNVGGICLVRSTLVWFPDWP